MTKIPFYLNRIRTAACEDGLGTAARETSRIVIRTVSRGFYSFYYTLNEPDIIWDGWDVCIILDACRPDVLFELKDEYDFISDQIPTRTSVGSTSTEWIDSTFDAEYDGYITETAYITGNPFSDNYSELNRLALLDEVWRYAWNADDGTQPPRPLTDRAITIWREKSPKRMIVHYMQPHFPSIPDPLSSGMELDTFGEEWPDRVWDQLETGELSVDRVRKAYLANCRYVLDEVELLLDNLDAPRVVITADHGNAFGEWGHYGHPEGALLPALRRVPWVETTGTDKRTHTPDTYTRDEQTATTVTDRLSALGYRE